MTRLVVHKVRTGGMLKLVPVVPKVISEGVLKLEWTQVICPACGQQVEAVATDGWVKGYCAVARQYVDFQVREGRDSRGHFVKGNVPWNKRRV